MTAHALDHAEHIADAHEYADELLTELADHIGDPDAVDTVLRAWLADLGARDFGLTCAAAVQHTFAACLVFTPLDTAPDGSAAFTYPRKKTR